MLVVFPVLAVTWGEVTGIAENQVVRVKWNTRSEVNADLFIIEHASNSDEFKEIGRVAAVGNSSATQSYEFVHKTPQPGANRYRIVQIDKAGATLESPTTEVSYAASTSLSWSNVGPNPVGTELDATFFSNKAQSLSLRVHDIYGKLVMTQALTSVDGANTVRLDVTKLDAGAYYLGIEGGGQRIIRKILKL